MSDISLRDFLLNGTSPSSGSNDLGSGWKYYISGSASTDPNGSKDDGTLYIIHSGTTWTPGSGNVGGVWAAFGSGQLVMNLDPSNNRIRFFKLSDIEVSSSNTAELHADRNNGSNRENKIIFVLADETTASFDNIHMRWNGRGPSYIGSSSINWSDFPTLFIAR